ncbi:hypothetical protein Q1695_009579 [Nippostrongylus brasiliensis]|nr:hypothetical protein Q1695_009579 [Nippostrongylus brasiliensis]
MQSFLVLFSIFVVRATALLCNQCGGERYSGGLRLSRSTCCSPTAIECASGLVCLRALVVSPRKSFILSGCHLPEDGLIGCDFHNLPHNATIHRCVCLDQSCQSYFPNGNCSTPTHPISSKSRPNFHHKKSHALSSTSTMAAIRLRSTTAETPPATSSMEFLRDDFRYSERRSEPTAGDLSSGQQRWQAGFAALLFIVLSIS